MGKRIQDGEAVGATIPIPDAFGSSFSEKAIRQGFIRKVYMILLTQLAVTTAFIAVFVFTPTIRSFYCTDLITQDDGIVKCVRASQNGFIVYIVSYVIFIVTYFSIACCESVRRKFPANIVTLCIFTLSFSLMVSSISVYHNASWVMMAVGITGGLCLGLTLFSFQTKWDFTGWGIYLFAAAWILFLFGIIAIIFFAKSLPVLYTVYSALIAVLFSFFLIYDTQRLMSGKKYSISPEEHIFAAIQLYIDVAYIFLAILGLGKN